MGRKKLKNKKEKVSIYLKPETLEEFKKHCEVNGVENYSEYIEELIKNYIKNNEK
jgi:metal-responsive CopG/Arc/MetJ family transcriptional regulator